MVKQTVKRQAVTASMSFPISAKDAQKPVMQEVLTTALENSLGMAPKSVTIISIDGVKLRRLTFGDRRLADKASIEFQIISNSNDASAVNQLKKDLEEAATEGSIVANVQKVASDKGVLIPALRNMPRAMPKPVVKSTEVEVEVLVQVKSTPAPTAEPPSPTLLPTTAPILSGASTGIRPPALMLLACSVLLVSASLQV